MLNAICAVRDQACRLTIENGGCTLENVTNIVEAYTEIDRVEFVGYEADPANPIWGEFLRWTHIRPYAGEETVVEVRYALHMDRQWRRFVVCKELCHALDAREGVHTVTDAEVGDLITELALFSAEAAHGTTPPVGAEKMAEVGAMEILIPLRLRKELIARGEFDRIGSQGMADRFGIPAMYAGMAFSKAYIEVIETLLP